MRSLLVLIFLASPIWASESKCVNSTFMLQCSNMTLEQVSSSYLEEEIIILSNVTGETSWNASQLARVNSFMADNINLKEEAVVDLLTIPKLSLLQLQWGRIELGTNISTSIFTAPNLRKLYLTGSLQNPPTVFNFSYLTELDLSHNKFPEVPKILSEKLIFLNLSSAETKIFENLKELKSLEELDLSNNNIRVLPNDTFTYNKELTKLWLQSNGLTSVYFNASELIFLDLNYNRIGTVKGDFFKGLESLTTLYLVENEIETMVEPFKHVKLLKILDLSYNILENLEGSWFENTLELEVLKLSHNSLNGLPSLNKPLMNLHHLNLSRNALEVLDSRFFEKTPALAVLDVTGNELRTIDGAMSCLQTLNKLHIAHNFLEISDNTFALAEKLNFVNLSYNSLTDMTLSDFGSNKLLRDVDVSHNNLKQLCAEGLAPKQIKNLDISYNQVQIKPFLP